VSSSTNTRRYGPLAFGLAAALTLAGCGSGAGSDGSGQAGGGGHGQRATALGQSPSTGSTGTITTSGADPGGGLRLPPPPGSSGGGTAGSTTGSGGPGGSAGSGGGSGSGSGGETVPTRITSAQEQASQSCGVNAGEGGRDMEFWTVKGATSGSFWGCDLTITTLAWYYDARPDAVAGSRPITVNNFRCNHIPEQGQYVQVICIRSGDVIYSSWLP
jgi:hypothetical protein